MGTLTFQLTDTIDGTLTKSYTNFSDADMAKMFAAYQSTANIAVNGTATHAQVFNCIVDQSINNWMTTTQAFNIAAADAAARASINTISIT